MAAKKREDDVGLTSDDPRRPLKAARLRKERERITGMLSRDPQFDDPDFEEWEQTVSSVLRELFGANEFVVRFRQLTFRPIRYSMGGRHEWYGNPPQVWRTSLNHADKLLGEALEEAGIPIPVRTTQESRIPPHHITVNVNNQNIFSPTVHVSVVQMLKRLDDLALAADEKDLAVEQVQELQREIDGAKRWPLIARSLEGLKALGKNVYREVAVPLVVEFLKHEAGLKG